MWLQVSQRASQFVVDVLQETRKVLILYTCSCTVKKNYNFVGGTAEREWCELFKLPNT